MRTLVFLAALTLGTCAVSAQPVLPDLAPREVEIRGELSISFPSLRRQPLIGFNPPPPVPEIGLRRIPYVQEYKQGSADLPQNPLRSPEAPRTLDRPFGRRFAGTAEAGYGRYASRYALLDAALLRRPQSRLTVHGRYDGRSSFAPFGTDAGFDGLEGTTRFSGGGARVAYGVEAEGSRASWVLYGIDSAGAGGAAAAPERTRTDASARIWLGTGAASRVQARGTAAVFMGDVVTDMFSTPNPATERSDDGAGATLDLSIGRLGVNGSAGLVRLDPDSGGGRSVQHFDAGGLFLLSRWPALNIRVGGRLLAFEALPDATGGVRRALTWFSPAFSLETALAPNIRLEVSQRPALSSSRPGDLFREHPFLSDQPQIEPVLYSVDGLARLRGFWRRVQVSGILTFRRSPNWRVFEHDAGGTGGYPRGISEVFHSAARTFGVGGELRLSPRPGFEARLGARFQEGRLTDLDTALPYFPGWTADAMISAGFDGNKGLVQATGTVMGPRPRDRTGTLDVPAHVDLDVRVSYAVTRQALLALEARNLLGETPVWDNYPEPSGTLLLGLGWRW